MDEAMRQEIAQWRRDLRWRQRRQVQPWPGLQDTPGVQDGQDGPWAAAEDEAARGTIWSIDGARRLSFGSNDYLGLSQDPRLIFAAQQALARHGVGATASALVCGHSPEHEALERELAEHVGLPQALSFHSGYAANVGVIPALVGKADAVFSDALNHACIIDGARLSRANVQVYPHGDMQALDEALARSSARRKLVVSDAVFSMDGRLANVPELLQVCERHQAWLMIDDAHGFGVLGECGEGSLAHWGIASRHGVAAAWQGRLGRLVYMATLGKAAGVAGAFVAGDAEVVDWLTQRARTYMFATAAPASLAAALRASLRIFVQEPQRRVHLRQLADRLRQGLGELPSGWALWPSPTPIQALVVGGNDSALRLMEALDARGIWVPAIRPPTVPQGQARLRISLSAVHSLQQVDALVQAIHQTALA